MMRKMMMIGELSVTRAVIYTFLSDAILDAYVRLGARDCRQTSVT